jgi:hypothetical protein
MRALLLALVSVLVLACGAPGEPGESVGTHDDALCVDGVLFLRGPLVEFRANYVRPDVSDSRIQFAPSFPLRMICSDDEFMIFRVVPDTTPVEELTLEAIALGTGERLCPKDVRVE